MRRDRRRILKGRMHQHAEHAKAVKEMLKPKTLDELFEELDLEMAED